MIKNDKTEYALNLFRKNFNCSQAVLSAFAKDLGLPDELALKIASGFGAGMGRLQQTCGAVTGSYMVIGLKYGNINEEDKNAKEKTYSLVQKFESEFKKLNNASSCFGLLNCDVNTDEGKEYMISNNLRVTICEKCIKDAVEILGNYVY